MAGNNSQERSPTIRIDPKLSLSKTPYRVGIDQEKFRRFSEFVKPLGATSVVDLVVKDKKGPRIYEVNTDNNTAVVYARPFYEIRQDILGKRSFCGAAMWAVAEAYMAQLDEEKFSPRNVGALLGFIGGITASTGVVAGMNTVQGRPFFQYEQASLIIIGATAGAVLPYLLIGKRGIEKRLRLVPDDLDLNNMVQILPRRVNGL